jgi:S1-C subfamily serine protease
MTRSGTAISILLAILAAVVVFNVFDRPVISTVAPEPPTATEPLDRSIATSTITTPEPTSAASTTVATYKTKALSIGTSSGAVAGVVLSSVAAPLHSALVNIVCTGSFTGEGQRIMSGSGIFIDPKGIILTNAHVAQYFLLADRGITCVIRTGSPAKSSYNAELIYISRVWLKENADILRAEVAKGTGESDMALLAVTTTATRTKLPVSFPYVPLARNSVLPNAPVAVASYGTQSLSTRQLQSGLFPTLAFGAVKDLYTFGTKTIDMFSLIGTAAAQEGSSGGGVVNADGRLVGLITTATVQGAFTDRLLNALTGFYIRANYAKETGKPIDLLLSQPIDKSVQDFKSEIEDLAEIITEN